MNLSDTFLTENPKFKFVSIVFAPYTGSKEYTYKTLIDLEVDDFVVVQTPSKEYQCVKVRAVLDPLEVDLIPGVNYKWIVQKVDMTHFEECIEMEKQVQLKLRKAEARKRQSELRQSSLEFLTDEERAETVKLVRL